MDVGETYIRVRPDVSGFRAETESGIKTALASVAKLVGATFAIGEAIHFGREAVQDAANLQKSMEVVSAEFGRSAAAVTKFNETAASQLGISAHAGEATAARFGILFHNLGIGTETAAKMTVGFEQLTGALSSIRGADPSDVMNRIVLAAAGNTRGLKELGIVIDSTGIKQEALKQGLISTLKDAITPAIKAQAIYGIATQHLGQFLDQAKAHSADLTNVQRRLSAEWANAREQIGVLLLPAVTRITTAFADWLGKSENQARVTRDVSAVVRALTGAVQTAWPVVKTLADWANRTADAVGGWKRVMEGLLAIKVATVVAGWATSLAGTCAKAAECAGAEGGIGKLKGALTGLTRSPWKISIALIGGAIVGAALVALQKKLDALAGAADGVAQRLARVSLGKDVTLDPSTGKLYGGTKGAQVPIPESVAAKDLGVSIAKLHAMVAAAMQQATAAVTAATAAAAKAVASTAIPTTAPGTSKPGPSLGQKPGAPIQSGIVTAAQSALGVPYLYGGLPSLTTATDCSGLVLAVMKKNGISVPRTAEQQYQQAPIKNPAVLLPGDLVFYDSPHIGHVGVYVGNGQMIVDPHTGGHVQYESIGGPGPVVATARWWDTAKIPKGTPQAKPSAAAASAAQVGNLRQAAAAAAAAAGIDPKLFASLITSESNWNVSARSSAGAIGLTQLMPATAKSLGVDPTNVLQNLRGGATYLAKLISQFHGDLKLALEAYNASPGKVLSGQVPAESVKYAETILAAAKTATASAATAKKTVAETVQAAFRAQIAAASEAVAAAALTGPKADDRKAADELLKALRAEQTALRAALAKKGLTGEASAALNDALTGVDSNIKSILDNRANALKLASDALKKAAAKAAAEQAARLKTLRDVTATMRVGGIGPGDVPSFVGAAAAAQIGGLTPDQRKALRARFAKDAQDIKDMVARWAAEAKAAEKKLAEEAAAAVQRYWDDFNKAAARAVAMVVAARKREAAQVADVSAFRGAIGTAATGASVAAGLTPATVVSPSELAQAAATAKRLMSELAASYAISDADRKRIEVALAKTRATIEAGLTHLSDGVQAARTKFSDAWASFKDYVLQAFQGVVVAKFQLNIDFGSAQLALDKAKLDLQTGVADLAAAVGQSNDPAVQALADAYKRVSDAQNAYYAALASNNRAAIQKTAADYAQAQEDLAAQQKATGVAVSGITDQGAQQQAQDAVNAITSAGDQILAAQDAIGQSQVDAARKKWEDITGAEQAGISAFIDKVYARIVGGKETFGQGMEEIRKFLLAKGLDISSVGDVMGQQFQAALTASLKNLGATFDGLQAAIEKLTKALDEMLGIVPKKAADQLGDYQASGENLGNAFADGIRSAYGAVEAASTELAFIPQQHLKLQSPAKKGPMADLDRWWAKFGQTLVSGMESDPVTQALLKNLAVPRGAAGGAQTSTARQLLPQVLAAAKAREQRDQEILDELRRQTGHLAANGGPPSLHVRLSGMSANDVALEATR